MLEGPARGAPGLGHQAVGAGHADEVEAPQVAPQFGAQVGREDFDVVVAEDQELAAALGQASVVALAQGLGVVDADDLVGLGGQELLVILADRREFSRVDAADDHRDQAAGLGLRAWAAGGWRRALAIQQGQAAQHHLLQASNQQPKGLVKVRRQA